jgi:hypothetical protein
LGKVQKRGNILAQEAGKDKVPATTPRNFVAKNAKTSGAGAHKDKKKEQKQGTEKHKKPYMESLRTKIDQLKSKLAEQGVAEGFNGEYDDEAGMAQSNLLTTARAVMGLLKTIKDRDNLPEWGQEKIAKAEMMLVSVWDYLQSQKAMGNDPQQGVAEGLSKRDQKDVDAIKAVIASKEAELKQPNADRDAIQQSIAHEKKRLALYGQGVAEGSRDDDEYGPKAREEWLKQQAYEKEYNKKKPSTPVKPVDKSKEQGVAEGPNDGKEDNFTIDDIKNLEQIRDFETLKAQAKELIKGKPARRMKPEKISWFYNHIDTLKNPLAVIKMMYDLMLAGEGNKVIGSRNSMSANSYRSRFGEQGVAEAPEDRTSYQVAKILSDRGIKYDPSQENELINAIGMVLVKELMMSPKQARHLISYDDDFVSDTLGELRSMEDSVSEVDVYMESLAYSLQQVLSEKAVSKKQQKFMGMVHAAQKGEKPASKEVAKVAKDMGKKDAKDFASTKHKGLPEKKKSKK